MTAFFLLRASVRFDGEAAGDDDGLVGEAGGDLAKMSEGGGAA